jgi:peptide/nickel transport system substrate-binding protein
MKRRTFLAGTAATLGATIAAPGIVAAQNTRVLRFIPQADVTVLDPVWTTAYVTRNHGFLVFDTLFGLDGNFKPSPQMAEGMTVENDGKLVRITLRDGLKWHDGERVLARDCTASIARWGKRDTFGQTLMAFTDELSAPDDKTIQFRLNKPFPLLPDALGKFATAMPAMMPERLAKTDPFTQITEMVGSGPFKFKKDERVPGSLVVYEKFADYKPRESGTPDWTSGPKIAYFDRVEWHINPDSGSASGALQNNEVDWWENPTQDLSNLLKTKSGITVEIQDPTGQMATMRLNHLTPPFNNPAVRRALLHAINQTDFMEAVVGDEPSMFHVPVGVFCPGTPMASTAGLDVFRTGDNLDVAKKMLAESGYKGEKAVLMAPTDFPILKALADVGADVMQKIGINVDYQAMEAGPPRQGRLERVPHFLGRHRPVQPARPCLPARAGAGNRAVRLAHQPEAGGFAQPVDRGRGPAVSEEDRRGNPASGVPGCALHPARSELLQHGLSQIDHRRAEGLRDVLERQAGLACRRVPIPLPFREGRGEGRAEPWSVMGALILQLALHRLGAVGHGMAGG